MNIASRLGSRKQHGYSGNWHFPLSLSPPHTHTHPPSLIPTRITTSSFQPHSISLILPSSLPSSSVPHPYHHLPSIIPTLISSSSLLLFLPSSLHLPSIIPTLISSSSFSYSFPHPFIVLPSSQHIYSLSFPHLCHRPYIGLPSTSSSSFPHLLIHLPSSIPSSIHPPYLIHSSSFPHPHPNFFLLLP